ncbi:Replicative DNA helicase [Gossypium arboreum]|uniref:Replicative DNA helicase n=1 Tax=Gossypium arboreum TaxID=29729 RepID=A0A0B0PQ27_GOSAR|nr:Replicative DNA helicase [Gossypium arboreum]
MSVTKLARIEDRQRFESHYQTFILGIDDLSILKPNELACKCQRLVVEIGHPIVILEFVQVYTVVIK